MDRFDHPEICDVRAVFGRPEVERHIGRRARRNFRCEGQQVLARLLEHNTLVVGSVPVYLVLVRGRVIRNGVCGVCGRG